LERTRAEQTRKYHSFFGYFLFIIYTWGYLLLANKKGGMNMKNIEEY